MRIIEEFIKGKKNDQSLCEDGYIVKPHFVAVIAITHKMSNVMNLKNIITYLIGGTKSD